METTTKRAKNISRKITPAINQLLQDILDYTEPFELSSAVANSLQASVGELNPKEAATILFLLQTLMGIDKERKKNELDTQVAFLQQQLIMPLPLRKKILSNSKKR